MSEKFCMVEQKESSDCPILSCGRSFHHHAQYFRHYFEQHDDSERKEFPCSCPYRRPGLGGLIKCYHPISTPREKQTHDQDVHKNIRNPTAYQPSSQTKTHSQHPPRKSTKQPRHVKLWGDQKHPKKRAKWSQHPDSPPFNPTPCCAQCTNNNPTLSCFCRPKLLQHHTQLFINNLFVSTKPNIPNHNMAEHDCVDGVHHQSTVVIQSAPVEMSEWYVFSDEEEDEDEDEEEDEDEDEDEKNDIEDDELSLQSHSHSHPIPYSHPLFQILQSTQQHVDWLNKQLQSLKQQVTEQQQQQHEDTTQLIQNLINRAQHEHATLHQQLAAANQTITHMTKDKSTLTTQLTAANQTITDMTNDNRKLAIQLTAANQTFLNTQAEHEACRANKKHLTTIIEQTKTASDERFAQLTNTNHTLLNKLAAANQTIVDTQSRIVQLTNDNSKLLIQLTTADQTITQLSNDKKKLTTTIEQIKTESKDRIAQLTNTNQTLITQNQTIINAQVASNAQINDLTHAINTLTTELATAQQKFYSEMCSQLHEVVKQQYNQNIENPDKTITDIILMVTRTLQQAMYRQQSATSTNEDSKNSTHPHHNRHIAPTPQQLPQLTQPHLQTQSPHPNQSTMIPSTPIRSSQSPAGIWRVIRPHPTMLID